MLKAKLAFGDKSDKKPEAPPPSYNAAPPPSYTDASSSSGFSLRRFSSTKENRPEVSEATELDPKTLLPTTFRIGRNYVPPVVAVPELVDHLTFLACLDNVQRIVRQTPTPKRSAEEQIPEDIKWAAFCERASHRFQAWASNDLLTSLHDSLITPKGHLFASQAQVASVLETADIDVLMAWHTYMLNPGAYEGDMERLGDVNGPLRGLTSLGSFPLSLIVS